MAGAQRYPSIAVREVDGFREEFNPSYDLPIDLRRAITSTASKRAAEAAQTFRTCRNPSIDGENLRNVRYLSKGFTAARVPVRTFIEKPAAC
jgi:hypothetical protein